MDEHGSSDDGSMKTGKQTVDLDSEKYTFEFAKNGSNFYILPFVKF